MSVNLNPSAADTDADIDYETFTKKYWPLAERLSNAHLQDGDFTVDEKTPEGVITYKLALDSFLAIKDKTVGPGTGFYSSKYTKNIQLDKSDPYTLQFEACSSSEGADDWTAQKHDIRPYLKIKGNVLFGNDAASSLLVKHTKTNETYEMSAAQAQKFSANETEITQAAPRQEGGEYKSHPEHEVVKVEEVLPQKGGVQAMGLFSTGAGVGRLVNFIIDGDPHPGVLKYRRDAKGHEYFGCEKHEHTSGDKRYWKAICL